MKAALTYGPFDIRVEDIPEPTPGPGQVKVKIAYCGICGSDPEIYEGTFGLLKAPWWPPAPFPTGHEASGTIVEFGPGLLGDWKVGQRVAMNFRNYCGACYYCRNKMEQFCEHVTSYEAGFAEYALYDGELPLPAARRRQLRAGRHARAGHHRHCTRSTWATSCPGKTVAISRRRHHRPAGAAGGHAGRRRPRAGVRPHAREAGAWPRSSAPTGRSTRCNEDLVAAGMELTDGRGFDTVFECSGNISAVPATVDLADKYGTIVWAGAYHEDATFPINPYYCSATS